MDNINSLPGTCFQSLQKQPVPLELRIPEVPQQRENSWVLGNSPVV